MLRLALATLLAAPLLAGSAPAFAAQQDFTLVNKTGYPIESVYVSKTNTNSWEEDVLGRDTLDDGEHVNISFEKGTRGCAYDLMVKYSDGDKSEWHNIDLCSLSRISLYWDRKAGTTRAVGE